MIAFSKTKCMLQISCLLLTLFFPALADRNISVEGTNYVAIGIGENESELKAKESACNAAKRELISYLFGVHVKVKDDMLRTIEKLELSQHVSVNSDFIRLKGVVTDVSFSSGTAKCTLRYPIKEANTEKVRIEKIKATLASKKMNRATFENTDSVNFGKLIIESNVNNAKIFLDGTMWGKSPLEIDRVPVGEHLLNVEFDGYESNSSKVHISIGETKRVFAELKRSFSGLEIIGAPENAQVWIDGILKGKNRRFEMLPGRITIRVEAPHHHPFQESFELAPGMKRQVRVTLVPKPVSISFSSKVGQADVYINGKKEGTTPLEKQLEPGKYSIEFLSASGIIDSQDIDVKPGKSINVVAKKGTPIEKSAKLAPIMMYFDSSLSKMRAFETDEEVLTETQSLHTETGITAIDLRLNTPEGGFVYVNGKLAAKRRLLIDKVEGDLRIGVEAPGYYVDELYFTVSNSDWEKRELGMEDSCAPNDSRCDLLTKKQSGYFILRKGMNNRFYVHLYKRRGGGNETTLATIVSRFRLGPRFKNLEWLETSYSHYDARDDKEFDVPLFLTQIPSSHGKIPATVCNEDGYSPDVRIQSCTREDLWLKPSDGKYSLSSLVYKPRKDITIGNRVIFIGCGDLRYIFGKGSVWQLCDMRSNTSCRVVDMGKSSIGYTEYEIPKQVDPNLVLERKYAPTTRSPASSE